MSDVAAQIEALIKETVPLYGHMDVSVEIGEDEVKAKTPFAAAIASHVGTIHPAFQWAAAELLGGLVALQAFGGLEDIFLVVRSVDIEFLRPARTDIVAEASFGPQQRQGLKDTLEKEGEVTFDLKMVVKDTEGQAVAKARGTYLIRPRRKAS